MRDGLKNIVFDMGGVLLRWEPYMACYRHCRDRELARELCNAIFTRPEWGKEVDGGLLDDFQYLQEVKANLDCAGKCALAEAILRDYPLDSLFPVHGMGDLVEDLKADGYHVYLLSNVGYRFRDYAPWKIPYLDLFDGIVLSSEKKLCKPDPALFTLACGEWGIQPGESLFVDDLPGNIAGAETAGLQGWCFQDANVPALREYLLG